MGGERERERVSEESNHKGMRAGRVREREGRESGLGRVRKGEDEFPPGVRKERGRSPVKGETPFLTREGRKLERSRFEEEHDIQSGGRERNMHEGVGWAALRLPAKGGWGGGENV